MHFFGSGRDNSIRTGAEEIWDGKIWAWPLKKVGTLKEWYNTGKMATPENTGVKCNVCKWVRYIWYPNFAQIYCLYFNSLKKYLMRAKVWEKKGVVNSIKCY